jgi:hypothetical protein
VSEVSPRVDGFHLFSGYLALVAGPVMFATGAPKGWACFVLGLGAALLASCWAIRSGIDLAVFGRQEVAAAMFGVFVLAVAVLYLTRTANDLPHVFPGYDGDSGRVLVERGALALLAGGAILGRVAMLAVPPRARHHP